TSGATRGEMDAHRDDRRRGAREDEGGHGRELLDADRPEERRRDRGRKRRSVHREARPGGCDVVHVKMVDPTPNVYGWRLAGKRLTLTRIKDADGDRAASSPLGF